MQSCSAAGSGARYLRDNDKNRTLNNRVVLSTLDTYPGQYQTLLGLRGWYKMHKEQTKSDQYYQSHIFYLNTHLTSRLVIALKFIADHLHFNSICIVVDILCHISSCKSSLVYIRALDSLIADNIRVLVDQADDINQNNFSSSHLTLKFNGTILKYTSLARQNAINKK
jgi:hypothetical protein